MGFSRQEPWGGYPFFLQGIFPTQGSNPGLLHCRQFLYHLSHAELEHTLSLTKQPQFAVLLLLTSAFNPFSFFSILHYLSKYVYSIPSPILTSAASNILSPWKWDELPFISLRVNKSKGSRKCSYEGGLWALVHECPCHLSCTKPFLAWLLVPACILNWWRNWRVEFCTSEVGGSLITNGYSIKK